MVDPNPTVTSDRPIRVFILDDHELVRPWTYRLADNDG
jgi:hypothetical protein